MKDALKFKILVAALLFAPLPALAADINIPVIVKNTTVPIWQTVLAGACSAGKELGVNVTKLGASDEADIAGEISILENAAANHPSAIVISPSSADALGPPIQDIAAKIPVIAVDTPADAKNLTAFLGTDNIKAGQLAADTLAAAMTKKFGKPEGKIAIISVIAGVQTLIDRDKGFTDQLKAKYPGIEVVTTRVGDGQVTTALNQTTDVMSAFPDLQGIFGDGIYVGLGAGQAVAESGAKDKIVLVTIDAADQMVTYLKNDVVKGLIVQDFFQMGYAGVQTAVKAIKGETVPAYTDTGVVVVTQDNITSPEAAKVLNPDLSCK